MLLSLPCSLHSVNLLYARALHAAIMTTAQLSGAVLLTCQLERQHSLGAVTTYSGPSLWHDF